jgi:hypothetical protein
VSLRLRNRAHYRLALLTEGFAVVHRKVTATMNTAYGWTKGDTLPMQCVWAAIAAGSAIIFTLAWPALSTAVKNATGLRPPWPS